MWFLQKQFFSILIFLLLSELQANCCNINDKSFICLFKANESKNCDCVEGYQTEVDLLFNDVPHDLHEKLLIGSLADFTAEEIINLPTSLIYFLPINKLAVLSGNHLASLIIAHDDHTPIAKKILQSIKTDQQRIEFLNFLVTKVITNNKILDLIGKTVYKWNYDVKDGKFQKLSNICGYALARLWTPYVLTTNKTISTRLLTLLAEVEQKQKQRILCNKYVQVNWKNLPKSVRRLWSFLSVNQSYPNPLTKWTVQQTALQYTFLLPDFNNNELLLIPFDELSKNALYDIDFDISQARFLFSMLMENSTLKDVKILYPTFFSKLSPLQIDKFKPEEWANETANLSFEKTHLSYSAAKQIFNKIASDRLSKKHINGYYKWTSDDLRHLPLIYTQPATSFLKFCATPPSIQSFIAVDSYMLTNRQAFYLSGCSSILSFPSNDPKLLLDLKYMINKAVPVSSLLYINNGNINYPLMSHLVSLIDNHNLPMAFYLLNITNPVKQTCFIKEMLKNKNNILFDQLAPSDIPGPIFDVLKQLYSNYTDRIDKLPKHILNVILENNDLLVKWTGNDSAFTKGLYNGYTCNFIRKLNSVNFIILISNYNAYLKQNGKVFPKNLQICVAEAFINYLKLKSKLTANLDIHLDAWEVEAVQGFVLTTLPIDVIVNSNLSDNILYSIGQLSFPELMIASQPQKLSLMVDKYITNILENRPTLSYEHLHILGNLIHFIPTTYLSVIDEQAFKFMVESGLIDTRICVDSIAKEKWADLLIKAFGNVENWSSDTLVTLSDLLIVLNQDQLNAIPDMSRLNSSDIILTRYADEIEFLSDNIPFYKGCVLILGDQYKDFTNSLSTLINFYLTSMQIQLQMISPINYNLNDQNKKIISSEVKGKIYKPNVLISLPKSDDIDKLSPKNNMFNKYFGGKEKQDVNNSLNIKKNIQVNTTPTEEEIINTFTVNQQISVTKNSTLILDIENSTTSSPILSTLNSSRYDQSLKNIGSDQDIEKPFNETFLPLLSTTNNHNKISNNKNSTEYEIQLAIDDSKLIINAIHLQGVVENRKKFHDDFKTNVYNITSNQSLLSEIVEISTMRNNKIFKINGQQKKRSLKLFFDTEVQVSCEALKMLGPASVTYLQFDSIIHSMSDVELENCVDLLGSFDINPELARHIWSRTKEKAALHTYGSVLSGLSVNDIKMLDLNIDRPWSLELIHLLSEYVKTDKIGEEIIKQFFTKSKANMPSHLWGSFGSLICKLPPRIFKIIMPNKELFWKTSSAFNTIKSCDMSCINNLASIAISVIGQSNTWKTAEVERMGIILSGINITQWQLLLNLNPKALEGLSSNTVKCLNEQQIKLMDGSHMKYLTPKSANALLENHSELLDFQTKETLLQLVNFEIKIDYSINVFESRNDYSIEMQAHSKAPAIQVLSFSILGAIIIVFYLNIIV